MNNELQDLIAEADNTLKQYSRLLYASSSKELQLEAIEAMVEIRQRICALKERMIMEHNEDAANALLSLQELISSMMCELHMWVALKDGNFRSAWDYLIKGQACVRTAIQAHALARDFQGIVNRLSLLEEILFPPQIFTSIGAIIRKSRCSICGSDYEECDHLKGLPYMGEICAQVITDLDLKEISIVKEPANKECRIEVISDPDGISRDTLTWEPITSNQPYDEEIDHPHQHAVQE